MATWSYLIYEILGAAGSTGFLGYLISDMLKKQFHVNIPWWFFALAATALIWALTHHGVQLSARITALLGGLELLIMLALGITFLIHPGTGSTYLAPLTPSSSPHHFGGILAGMVFSILALSGFEAPAPLAQEARLPGKFIGQAIMLSLGSIGVFYIFTSYASAIGWGTGDMAAFASNPNPYYVLGHALWGAGWWFVVLAIINSAVGVGLACTNAASRVMYTMGRAGTLPASFGRIHPIHRTPTFAIAFAQIAGMAAILLVGLLLRPDYIFGFLETIATLAVIILYVMANLALTRYMRREQRAKFHCLATRGGPMGRDPGSATCPLCHRLPGTLLALQHNALPVSRITYHRICLHAVARVAQPRSPSPRRDHADSHQKLGRGRGRRKRIGKRRSRYQLIAISTDVSNTINISSFHRILRP